jgi:acyl-CoA synthetase (AMP-forming)/AMP-acid ligase II
VTDHSFARAWRTVAELAPTRVAIECGERTLTFADFHQRAARLAGVFHDAGIEPGDKVAIELVNTPEYLVVFFAAQLIGAVPVNVNYRYVGAELAYLLDNSDAVALVFHDEFATTVHDALATLSDDRRPRLLLSVRHNGAADQSGAVPGALDFDETVGARAPFTPAREPTGDDLVFLYTGGTTGAPKAVMWRSDDLYVALWQMSRPATQPPEPATTIARGHAAATLLPACPLMHGTGLFITLSTLSGGGRVVLIDTQRLDAERTWHEVETRRVEVVTIVGDAFARPLLDVLDRAPDRFDLSSLRAITSSGVTWSPDTKSGLLRHLPNVSLVDSLGASEGIMTRTVSDASSEIKPARFRLSERVVVIADDGTRCLPGDERVGLLGVGGPIPLGYYKDDTKTAATFRTVDGTRFSVPGDYAVVETDGTIRLLGRGSACINTGGEKVYPEEVETALLAHPTIADCVVVGVPDDRWGEMVVALVTTSNGAAIDTDALRAHCRATLAGYKVPKAIVSLPSLQRSPAGKADYTLLRGLAARELTEATR